MTVHIIGLGATAQDFKPDGNITIGVNDVQGCDYQVIVDRQKAFSGERFERILNHVLYDKCKKLFSQLDEWFLFDDFELLQLKAVHAHNNRWNEFIPSSNNSPFVACGVAHRYFNATEIYLYGVDFNNHPNIKNEMRDAAVRDYILLQKILNKRGCVIIPHKDSYLFGRI